MNYCKLPMALAYNLTEIVQEVAHESVPEIKKQELIEYNGRMIDIQTYMILDQERWETALYKSHFEDMKKTDLETYKSAKFDFEHNPW